MRDARCVELLQWALPRLHMRWPGFRKVRRQVCRRIDARIAELGLDGPSAYRAHLESHPQEWSRLEVMCRVTISRFYRDHGVMRHLASEIFPDLEARARKRGESEVRAWSAGCGAGEEPYTLAILWRREGRRLPLRILGTDVDEHQLERARDALYPPGCTRELPDELRRLAFDLEGGGLRLRPRFRAGVELRRQDLRRAMPDGPFDLISCRNLAFTYFDDGEQVRIARALADRLVPGGVLVLGAHERLPATPSIDPAHRHLPIYRRRLHV